MTSKEKAKELVDIYFKEVSDANPLEDILVSAKKCALICVNEIIKMAYVGNNYDAQYEIQFFKKVKQEINKL